MAYNACVTDEENEFTPNLRERLERTTREDDWAYIAAHPEIRTIIRSFLHRIFEQRPVNIRAFAADFAQALRSEDNNRSKGIRIEGKGNIL